MVLLIRIIKNNKDKTSEEMPKDYMQEGLCLGMIFGAALGTISDNEKLGVFAAVGMVLGMAIGSAIRRKKIMLRAIGFLLFGLGYLLTSPQRLRDYKKDKSTENLILFIAGLLIGLSSLVLSLGYFIGK